MDNLINHDPNLTFIFYHEKKFNEKYKYFMV